MPDPPLTRDQVGAELRRLRTDAGLTLVQAAKAAGIAQSSLTRYEQGRFAVPADKAEALLAAYRPDRATRTRILAAVREKQPRYKRVVLHRGAAAAQVKIADIEGQATRQVTFAPTVIPGLLQSEGYMRALAEGALPTDEVTAWIAPRRNRQAILTRDGHEFEQIVTAGALLWALGGSEVMRGQLEHLVEMSHLGQVRLGVVPPAAPVNVLPLHAFDLFEFAGGERMVHFGTHGGVVTITDDEGVGQYLALLERVREAAVFGDEARAELERAREWHADPDRT